MLHKTAFIEVLKDSLAVTLRCDANVDRTQIDKTLVLAKVVSKPGEEALFFLGASEPDERGAKGILNFSCCRTLGASEHIRFTSRSGKSLRNLISFN